MNMMARIASFKEALIKNGLVDQRNEHPSHEIMSFTQWKDSNPRPWNNWRDFTNFKDWESCGY